MGATEKPQDGKCPARSDISSRTVKAPATKVEIVSVDAPKTDGEKDAAKEEKKEEKKEALAQKKDVNPPPEDPIVNTICEWQLSEDGKSCVTTKNPCQMGATEKPQDGKCPARSDISSRTDKAPATKVESVSVDAPKTDGEKDAAKEEKKAEKKEALAQIRDETKDAATKSAAKDDKKADAKETKKDAKDEKETKKDGKVGKKDGKKGSGKIEAEPEKKEKTPVQKTGKKEAVKAEKKVEKKVETKESKEVDAYIHEGEDKPADPIPETPNQKANPNYCVYKVKADGTPHPDACACKYVKNNNGDCVAFTNDCFPAETIPTNEDCSA